MSTPIQVGNLGLVEEFALEEWLKADGDVVSQGEVLAYVETEKARIEVLSPASGTLSVLVPASDGLIDATSILGHIHG